MLFYYTKNDEHNENGDTGIHDDDGGDDNDNDDVMIMLMMMKILLTWVVTET